MARGQGLDDLHATGSADVLDEDVVGWVVCIPERSAVSLSGDADRRAYAAIFGSGIVKSKRAPAAMVQGGRTSPAFVRIVCRLRSEHAAAGRGDAQHA